MQIVLASHNRGKLKECQALLGPLGVEVRPQGDFAIPEAEEPFGTFLENALQKARHASRLTGLPAIADDSGLCVAALGGLPGVKSARFSGEGATDAKNNALLLEKMVGITDRRAYFVSVLVAVRHADDPEPIVSVGRWFGEVLTEPAGSGGFGYDPLFFSPVHQKTAASLTPDEKNAVSHRGQAFQGLIRQIHQVWLGQ